MEVTNRFKGLDLIDRVPEELWTKVRDILQQAVIKTIPKKKKCKKAKWLSEAALQVAEKRREARGKGEKERYTHLNAEFQRIARRYKKAFLSNQCKEIEESNRMGKTTNFFKKIRDTKGTFYAKMGTIKDRNGTDLTEAEDTPSYLVRNRTLGPPLENNPEIPPSSRDEGLRLLHGLATNLATSLQTPQEA